MLAGQNHEIGSRHAQMAWQPCADSLWTQSIWIPEVLKMQGAFEPSNKRLNFCELLGWSVKAQFFTLCRDNWKAVSSKGSELLQRLR